MITCTAHSALFRPLAGVSILLAALLLTAACGTRPPAQEIHSDAGHPHDDDELLVLDPPADYLRHLPDMGLEVLDVTHLEGMGSKLYHLRIIDGRHPHHARRTHGERFPHVVVDAHHHFEHHAKKRGKKKRKKIDRTYTGRRASRWTAAKKSCASGVRIGVVDGVVDTRHKAFRGTKLTYRSLHLKGEALAKSGHGTAVTSVIAGGGKWAGVLPGAEIYAANVFHRNRKGEAVGSAKSIVRALDWLIAKKVQIINLSIGGGPNKLIRKAIQHAAAGNVILIASSGNNGPFSKKKSYPGAYPVVIAITAVDRFERNARFATSGKYIDFAAPGVDIWAAFKRGGKAMSGTSFAAPIVTAYAAAAWKHKGVRSTAALRAYLKRHAKDRGNPGHDKYTGWGIVQPPPAC